MDRRNWIIPSNQLIGQDPTIRFLVDQRRSAYDMIEKSMEVVAAANLAISHRMGEVDPDKAPSPTEPLTPHQAEGLKFICEFYSESGYAPTSRELCDGMNWPSTNSGDVVIRTLVSKGYLNKLAQKWRGIVPMFDSHQNKINHQK